jgi:hypothetical protein
MRLLPAVFFIIFISTVSAQQSDTAIVIDKGVYTLPDVMVRSGMDYQSLLKRIKDDTTFYKAFRNMHMVSFTAYNSVRMLDKKGNLKASWNSKSMQKRRNHCRTTEILEQQVKGDYFNRDSTLRYSTGQMYASLFLSKGTICGEDNIVAGKKFTTQGKRGIDKHKEQLKMLFFNPGRKIPGIPFIGDKLDVYDASAQKVYNYTLDFTTYRGKSAYIFIINPKPDPGFLRKDDIVLDKMETWFDVNTMEVLARNYSLSYKAGVYDFDVSMEVEFTKLGSLLLPQIMRYKGNFSAVGQKREYGEFTATLFDYKL